ncbi:MAG TPA: Xaa-Pro peptidase family protein [Acidimicrobiales bacterium]|nr:Xaa-Pro peptidase family protein [Acidimicrobiales bacterium]
MSAARIARLQSSGVFEGPEAVDVLYISNLVNVRYLCGFTGSNGSLLIGREGAWFLTDGRYREQAPGEVSGAAIEVYTLPDQLGATLGRVGDELGAKRVGFEADHVAVSAAQRLGTHFPSAELVPTSGLVEDLRRVKEPAELDRIRRAAELADAGVAYIIGKARPGVTERELAIDLESYMRREGAEAVSFPSIVAAAERSAMPHAHPTSRTVETGRFLLFDLGCIFEGYCSDLTRTVVVGQADDRHREIYALVAAAQQAGLDALAAGKTGAEVDGAAREVIVAAGYGEEFGHSLGHGVGLDIHEAPTLRSTSADVLEPGHVVTVEPGVYLPGWGGVRIEDLTVVTSGGAEVLSHATKELLEV